MAQEMHQSAQPAKRGGFWRFLWRTLTVLVILVAVGGSLAYWQSRRAPEHAFRIAELKQSVTPGEYEALGRGLKNRLARELSNPFSSGRVSGSPGQPGQASPRPLPMDLTGGIDEIRKVKVSLLELNAWMDVELKDWLANQSMPLPDGVSKPGMWIVGKQLVLYFQHHWHNQVQHVSLYVEIKLRDDGRAAMRVDRMQLGELGISGGLAKAAIGNPDDPDSELSRIREALDGKIFDPVIPIDGDKGARRGRVVGVNILDSGVEMSVLIERNVPPSRAAQVKPGK